MSTAERDPEQPPRCPSCGEPLDGRWMEGLDADGARVHAFCLGVREVGDEDDEPEVFW